LAVVDVHDVDFVNDVIVVVDDVVVVGVLDVAVDDDVVVVVVVFPLSRHEINSYFNNTRTVRFGSTKNYVTDQLMFLEPTQGTLSKGCRNPLFCHELPNQKIVSLWVLKYV